VETPLWIYHITVRFRNELMKIVLSFGLLLCILPSSDRSGLKPSLGLGPWSKAWGLLEYDFPLKNWYYFGKIMSKNLKSQMQIISFAIFSLSLVPLFLFEVFWSYA
jgi:hypothetical protein